MDLTLRVEDYKLNIRAAAMIIHNNKVLVHHNHEDDHYCLIGGRIAIGESSEETVKREVEEEIGKEIEVLDYAATIENFFDDSENIKFHEYMFVYRAEFIDEEDKKIENSLENLEGHDYLSYDWLEIDKIDEYNLQPSIVKDILKDGKYPVHKIYVDKK